MAAEFGYVDWPSKPLVVPPAKTLLVFCTTSRSTADPSGISKQKNLKSTNGGANPKQTNPCPVTLGAEILLETEPGLTYCAFDVRPFR